MSIPVGVIVLAIAIPVSIHFGIHWGVICGALSFGFIKGLFVARDTSSFHARFSREVRSQFLAVLGQILEFIFLIGPTILGIVIWLIFGWKPGIAFMVIQYGACGVGIIIMIRFIRKTTREVVQFEQAMENARRTRSY